MYIHYCISIMETYWIICFMSNITPMLNVQYILTHIRALYSVWIIIYGYSVGHWQCVCKCMRWLCPCVCALCVCLSGGFFSLSSSMSYRWLSISRNVAIHDNGQMLSLINSLLISKNWISVTELIGIWQLLSLIYCINIIRLANELAENHNVFWVWPK